MFLLCRMLTLACAGCGRDKLNEVVRKQRKSDGAGEMARPFKTRRTGLSKDFSLLPSTHIGSSKPPIIASPENAMLLASVGICVCVPNPQADAGTQYTDTHN